MSRITVKANPGAEKVFLELKSIDRATRRAIRHAWFELGDDLKSEANRAVLARDKTGRTYVIRSRVRAGRRQRVDPPKIHRSSAPGQSHANMFGDLRKSLSWAVHGSISMDFGYGAVDHDAPFYGEFVEFGTSRMAARPTLQNAINATQRNAEQHWERAMFREFND